METTQKIIVVGLLGRNKQVIDATQFMYLWTANECF